jgi:hypothetical protein
MSKKKTTKIFYVGKNLGKSDSDRSPITGERNSNIDFYDKATGSFHWRRKIGKSGNAIKDYDAPDFHKSKFHVHDFVGKQRITEDRAPNKKEQREINKVRKKRRFWK